MAKSKSIPTTVRPSTVEWRVLYNFCACLGLTIEQAEEAAKSDEDLMETLEAVKVVAKRTSIRYGGV